MTIAGLWRYGDWQHVATGCNALVWINACSCSSWELTTATLFYMALQSASFRTTQLKLCSNCQDDLMTSYCCANCTGCQWNTGSSTRWRWSQHGSAQCQSNSAVTYRSAYASCFKLMPEL